MTRCLVAFAALTLTACNAMPGPGAIVAPGTADWRAAATGSDRERLRGWRGAFSKALERARAAGHGADIAREGALLDPDAALGQVPIPNGDYKCRVIKLGAKSAGLLDYIAYPAFDCRIRQNGALQSFAKINGSQRQVGLIFAGDALRQVFLGTLVLGDEQRAMQYGRDPDREVAGYVEKIGAARWRLVMPSPAFESLTDVLELVPAN